MKAKNPELQKVIDCMNADTIAMITDFRENLDALALRHEEDTTCDLINGSRKTVKIRDVIPEMHDDLKKIKSATEWLFDFSKLHYLLRKYKLYWVFLGLLGLFFSHNVWQPVLLELIKKI